MDTNQPSLKPVKISCGYSAKESANYNSSSYSINLEMEVLVNGKTADLESKADLLYDLCRRIVTKQRSASIDSLLAPNERPPATTQPAVTLLTPPVNNNVPDVASPKQVKYIFALSRAKGFDSKKTKDIVYDQYGKAVENLSKKDAAAVIDELKALKQAA